MKIAIYGVGGVGGYFGGALARAGHDVAFVARGAHLAAIQASGLRVRSPDGDFRVRPSAASADPAAIGPVDAVIVAVKSIDLPKVAAKIGPLLHDDTFVVPLLNGVDADKPLVPAAGRSRVGKGLTRIISRVSRPGEVVHRGLVPYVAAAEHDGRASPRARALVAAFLEAGVKAEVPENIDAALWHKFLMVCSIGGVCAACRLPVGPVRSLPESRRVLIAAMTEIATLAKAKGVSLPSNVVESTMEFVDAMPADADSSLQRDIAAGKPSELDSWSGAVVRMGAETGVPVPAHSFVYSVLLPGEQEARRS